MFCMLIILNKSFYFFISTKKTMLNLIRFCIISFKRKISKPLHDELIMNNNIINTKTNYIKIYF